MTALPFGPGPREVIGGNNPPQAIDRLPEALRQIGEFLKAEPAIQDHATAHIAAELVKRAKAILGEVEDERKEHVSPLNQELKAINEKYREAKTPVEQCLIVLSDRLTDFLTAEERRRVLEAEEKRKAADEAARAVHEVQAKEAEALENAADGEVGVDVGQLYADLSQKFKVARRTEREADRAKRSAHVKIGTGYGRAVSLRATEILFITDPAEAIAAIGMTEKISEAILSASRTYRQIRGELPPGVSSRQQRKI
jgi:hypothetical protein